MIIPDYVLFSYPVEYFIYYYKFHNTKWWCNYINHCISYQNHLFGCENPKPWKWLYKFVVSVL